MRARRKTLGSSQERLWLAALSLVGLWGGILLPLVVGLAGLVLAVWRTRSWWVFRTASAPSSSSSPLARLLAEPLAIFRFEELRPAESIRKPGHGYLGRCTDARNDLSGCHACRHPMLVGGDPGQQLASTCLARFMAARPLPGIQRLIQRLRPVRGHGRRRPGPRGRRGPCAVGSLPAPLRSCRLPAIE
jgi:hypothetical protein